MCYPAGSANPDAVTGRKGRLHWQDESGIKGSEGYDRDHPNAFGWKKPNTNSRSSPKRKFASAMIAKIPLPLSRYIAATFKPAVQFEEAAE